MYARENFCIEHESKKSLISCFRTIGSADYILKAAVIKQKYVC